METDLLPWLGTLIYLKMLVFVTTISVPKFMFVSKSRVQRKSFLQLAIRAS